MTIGKTELENMGCGTPGCGHDHSVLYLHPNCHPNSGIFPRYVKKDGVLVMVCAKCDGVVGAVWVGEDPPKEKMQ